MKQELVEFHGMFLQPSETADTLIQTSWADTPLGPAADWPETLKLMVQQCLNAAFPMTIGWGPQALIIYNDVHLPILGAKHPHALGRPALEVFDEISPFLQSTLQQVFERGESLMFENQHLPLHRGAPDEPLREGYFTLNYLPIHDLAGNRCGALSIATETTEAVLQQRRRATTTHLAELLIEHPSESTTIPDIREALLANRQDFGRVIFYQVHDDGRTVVPVWGHPAGVHRSLRHSPELRRALHHLSELGPAGNRVCQVGPRTFANMISNREIMGNRAMLMLVEPSEDVAVNSRYEAFLQVVHEVVVGGFLRILSEQSALSEVRQQLGERERMYRALFEHSGEAVVLVEPGGAIVAANPASAELLGYDRKNIRQLSYRQIAYNEEGAIDQALTQLASHGRTRLTLRLRRFDGTTLLADASAVQFRDPVAQSDRIIVLLRDAQPRLLTQQQLTTSARMQALGELTGGISHDFNNLLNVIINGTEELLEQLPASDPEVATAELILESSNRAADLTRQLLAFSQRRPMQVQTVAVRETVGELVELLERTLEGGVTLDVQLQSRAVLQTDPSQLQNALLNLCLNARDAMPNGGPLTLEVLDCQLDERAARRQGVSGGAYVLFRVSDQGTGIPEQFRDRVVEPFMTTRPDHQGLGLSMVYGYVRQSGGSMRFDSEMGTGTRVELLLPVNSSATGSQPARSKRAPTSDSRHRARHVLMVEDNEMLGPMLKRVLEQSGYRVSLVTDAESASMLLQQDPSVELLVTDIVLGGARDGWSLIEEARQRVPAPAIISMSGYAAGDFHAQASHLDIPSLTKPFRPAELIALLQELIPSD